MVPATRHLTINYRLAKIRPVTMARATNNFRLFLDVHHFFADHRALCLIYINTGVVKTVKDLRSHVRQLFPSITAKFDLAMGDAYIPAKEDVHVLMENDVITAVPRKVDNVDHKMDTTATLPDPLLIVMNRDGNTAECSEDLVNKNKKKKKIHKNLDSECNTKASPFNEPAAKRIKRDSYVADDEPVQKENGRKNLCQKEVFFTPKPHVAPLQFDPSKPKIVAPIYVNRNGTEHLEKSTRIENEQANHSVEKTIAVLSSNVVSTNHHLDNNSYSSDEKSVIVDVVAPRRRRVRKRKKKEQRHKVDVDSHLQETVVEAASSISDSSAINKHIRFEDNLANELQKRAKDCSTPVQFNGSIKSVSAMESPNCVKQGEIIEASNTPCKNRSQNSEGSLAASISEESILKCPLVEDYKFRCGDMIAFQVLRVSENYTPEVSGFITAKVKTVTEQDILLNILYGAKHLSEPQGKFALECPDEDKSPDQSCDLDKMFRLTELLNPRLLFP